MELLFLLINIYVWILLARVVFSFIRVPDQGPVASIYRAVYVVTEPPLSVIRSVVPPIRMGAGALDLSPLILFFALFILQGILGR
jgi:YggT family protein